MDWDLPDELVALQDSVRRLAQDKVRPRAREIDETGEYPDDLFALFGAGRAARPGPARSNTAGAGPAPSGSPSPSRRWPSTPNTAALMLLLTRLPTGPLLIAGTEAQKQRYLPGIAEGTTRAAFGLSEPQAGSDVAAMQTRARSTVEPEGGWVLNGVKCWMSGVAQADWYTVFAKTGDAAAGATLDHRLHRRPGRRRRRGGLHRPQDGGPGRRHRRAAARTTCSVPAGNVIGEVGGFRLAMLGLNAMRPLVAARGIGLAEGALMYATEYAEQRAAFGRT